MEQLDIIKSYALENLMKTIAEYETLLKRLKPYEIEMRVIACRQSTMNAKIDAVKEEISTVVGMDWRRVTLLERIMLVELQKSCNEPPIFLCYAGQLALITNAINQLKSVNECIQNLGKN